MDSLRGHRWGGGGGREDIDEDGGREGTSEDEDVSREGKRAKVKDREEMRMRTEEDEVG